MNNTTTAAIIVETERLVIREIIEDDAAFMLDLLNTPSFIKYIGDRGVRSVDDARTFIETRYRQSYRDHGYGLFAVDLRTDGTPVGMCGFVRRDSLPGPDIGFAFLAEHERKGYGFESAAAVMKYGRDTLGFSELYAITSLDNDTSGRLLTKLGFEFSKLIETPEGETIKLYYYKYP
ncbi:MAG TPA: GNAT family N-acetyltransferase [Pyrinomonadaceae bacterium]